MPNEPATPRLGAGIRQLREERETIQEELAFNAGITVTTLGRIERGTVNPTWTTIERIAEALDVTLVQLAAAVERA